MAVTATPLGCYSVTVCLDGGPWNTVKSPSHGGGQWFESTSAHHSTATNTRVSEYRPAGGLRGLRRWGPLGDQTSAVPGALPFRRSLPLTIGRSRRHAASQRVKSHAGVRRDGAAGTPSPGYALPRDGPCGHRRFRRSLLRLPLRQPDTEPQTRLESSSVHR